MSCNFKMLGESGLMQLPDGCIFNVGKLVAVDNKLDACSSISLILDNGTYIPHRVGPDSPCKSAEEFMTNLKFRLTYPSDHAYTMSRNI